MESIGLVVNPIAGMGGRVGLKGTDGVLEEARRRGATPRAPGRAREAMSVLAEHRPALSVYTAAGEMGADPARAAGYDPVVVHEPAGPTDPTDPDCETDADDTRATVQGALEQNVDLVLFVGGDGTAVDVATALEEVESSTPVLGVPAGVKVYSAVFGVTPADAGHIAGTFEAVEPREINDIDEDAYREGEVRATPRGVVNSPVGPTVQSGKQRPGGNLATLATGVARTVDSETTYVFGPGGTVGAIQEEIGMDPTPLGVDVWRHGSMLVRDGSETAILDAMEGRSVIVVSPIGGQGFLFGRGNQQLSPAVIRSADDILVVASEQKLDGLEALRVDTDDEDLDASLRGWHRVRTGQFTTRLVPVV